MFPSAAAGVFWAMTPPACGGRTTLPDQPTLPVRAAALPLWPRLRCGRAWWHPPRGRHLRQQPGQGDFRHTDAPPLHRIRRPGDDRRVLVRHLSILDPPPGEHLTSARALFSLAVVWSISIGEFCIGDTVLNVLGLKAWSNIESGTPFTKSIFPWLYLVDEA